MVQMVPVAEVGAVGSGREVGDDDGGEESLLHREWCGAYGR